MKSKPLLLTALLTVLMLNTGAVQARSLGKMFEDAGLSQADLSVMETAALQLIDPLGRPGDARRWSNPDSRSKGAVTLGRIEGNCAELVHNVSTVRRPGPVTFRIWRCRSAEGKWRLSAGPQ